MYKLFEFGKTSFQKYSSVSLRNLAENQQLSAAEKTCILYKHLNLHSRVQLRKLSSLVNSNLNKSQKVTKKKKSSKYNTDILVVTGNSSVLKKANVKKLSSKELKLLTTSSIHLNELYKLKYMISKQPFQMEHCYNDLTIIDNFVSVGQIDEPKTNVTSDKPKLALSSTPEIKLNHHASAEEADLMLQENEIDLESIKIVNAFQPEEIEDEISENTKTTKPDKPTQNHSVTDQKYREEIASKTLAAYIEMCNHLKKPHRGLGALYSHRVKSKKHKRVLPMKNVNVYCTLLKGFAHTGDYGKLKEVLHIMEEEKVELDLQCHIAILECLGRINIQNSHLKDIRIFAKEAQFKGFTFDRLMNEGVFLHDEREVVLATMQAYDPKYVPKYERPVVWYNNHLVNHLNHEKQLSYTRREWTGDNGGLFTPSSLEESVKRQFELEESGYVTIKSISSKTAPTEEIVRYREIFNEHLEMWQEAVHESFNKELALLTAEKTPLNLEVYLRSIPVDDMVAIVIDEAKKIASGSETYSPTLNMLHKFLGHKVYARYRILMKQKTGVLDKVLKLHNEYCREYAITHGKYDHVPSTEVFVNPRIQWQWLEHDYLNEGTTISTGHQPWVPPVIQEIGKFLYRILLHELKVNVDWKHSKNKCFLPAFYTIFRNQSRMVMEEVKPHPELSKLFRASQPETLTFPAYEVPMLCPPLPWVSVEHGGYLVSPCDVVRLPTQAAMQKQRLAESNPVQLYPSLDALNQLGSTPWKVNKRILDVILEVFCNGGSERLDVPVDPSTLDPPPSATPDMNKMDKHKIFRQKLQYRRKKNEMYSLWCDCLYRLSLANHFRDDIFWLPHNMDFRGRVYPVPPHLNHLGSDLARSILIFAEPRPLGPKGLDWLKIHLINLTGLKKRESVDSRLKYANEIMDLILDSADNPLTGKQWWVQSDEPWQTLACCVEIANAVRSGIDPEKYLSCFPIHQDGSCNGLQHYAALGRDSAGAHSVNLTPSEVPQDVYSAVVVLVEKQRAEDAENGIDIAKVLEGFVTRKVIKQTIMTTVYGVTRFGARLQIAKQLKDLENFPKDAVWPASSYLTRRTFDSLKTMFTSTKEIQDWFTECAKLISGVNCKHIEWVTPLGLPIIQPYVKYRKISPGYEGFSIDKYAKPNTVKQKNAFPPNFIHSLDSCHMMLTSLHAERAGITFVSVHDCYWTHPSTVHIMSKICREQFVALHSEPILEDLSTFLFNKYRYEESDLLGDGSLSDLNKKKLNRTLKQLPKTGNFDIRQVLNSIYFFS